MDNTKQKLKGAVEEIGGKIKKSVGQAIGSEQIEAEGTAQELKGKGRQEAAKAGERIAGKAQEVGGKIERAVGKLIGSEELEADGDAHVIKGDAKQRANKS